MVFADQVEFPRHRIVHRVGTGVAPVTVEAVFKARRAGTAKLEQGIAGQQCCLGGENLRCRQCRGYLVRRPGPLFGSDLVEKQRGPFQHRFARMNAGVQIADNGQHVRVLCHGFNPGTGVGAGVFTDVIERVAERGAGDAQVECTVK